ncbi:MAG: 30S ribosomal protein S4 [Endomicrobiia bacterium]|nr:30S ribosomal protein S4 [Endomicrobiaceae bacterium]MDD3053714.1 30S ribosomal protein S4 [Endomicrobiaceae bacterium]MDD3922703.1 30S ribosomal protein S4 [Endomicrobiaceae bacterium]MDD5102119.1 30S ribosomal protein S4 [Endomicrobiaceae bacterium]
MSRYIGSVCKQCRTEREKLFLKGDRCSTNCTLEKKRGKNAPGQHGARKSKMSDYGKHLREKQKAKRVFGLTEQQFKRYFEVADKLPGLTGDTLLKLLELRLDNVVYKMGLSHSRKMARQMVMHGNITVNGKKVDVPRYEVSIGEIISVKEKYKANSQLKKLMESPAAVPSWLNFSKDTISGTIIGEPLKEEFSHPINGQLIVELYSK